MLVPPRMDVGHKKESNPYTYVISQIEDTLVNLPFVVVCDIAVEKELIWNAGIHNPNL